MCRISFTLVILIALAVLSISGCMKSPTLPADTPAETTGVARSASVGPVHHCLGRYTLAADIETGTVEVLPLRTSDWHFNLTGVLNMTMGVQVAIDPDLTDPPNGLFSLNITLTHPFETKPKFSGFDVKGILMTPGSLEISPLIFADVDETRLLNANGYTRWWNPTEFTQSGVLGYTDGVLANASPAELTATINPYMCYADILGVEGSMFEVFNEPLDSDQGRGVFTAGSSNTRNYYIKFPLDPGPQIKFGYAIDASWVPPNPNPPDEIPDDFPIEANQPEAYHLAVAQTVNSLYYDSETSHGGGVLRLLTNVYDWQGQQAGNIAGEVEVVRIFSPDLFSGGASASFLNEDDTTARYTVDLYGTAVPAQPGEVLIAVRAGSYGGPVYDQGFTAPSPAGDVSAWQALVVEVVDPDCAADSNNAYTEAAMIGFNDTAVDTLCLAEDPEDWYRLDVPTGHVAAGRISFIHDAGVQEMWLADSQGQILILAVNSDGYSEIDFTGTWEMEPGIYYICCKLSTDAGAIRYLLETDFELTDVSPTNPVEVTNWDLDLDGTWLYPVAPDHCYVTGPAGAWECQTATDISWPVRIMDEIKTRPAMYPPYLYFWEDWTDDPAGIDLAEFPQSGNPVLHEDVLVFPHMVEALAMNSEHLYVAVDTGTKTWVHVYDYESDPANPTELNTFEVPHNQKKMLLLDPEGPNTVLVTLANNTMALFDVEDPLSVTPGDSLNLTFGIYLDIATTGVYVINTSYDDPVGNLRVYKYDPVSGLTFWGYIALNSVPEHVTARGTYAYVADGIQGFSAVDFHMQNSLTMMGAAPAPYGVGHMAIDDNTLYMISPGTGFALYDLSDAANPAHLKTTRCLNNPTDGVVIDDHAFFIESSGAYKSLMGLDITDPANAGIVSEIGLGDIPTCIASYQDYIMIGSMNYHYIWWFDVSDPENPSYADSETCGSYVQSVAMSPLASYACLGDGTIKVFDTSNLPTVVPKPDGTLPSPDPVGDVVVYYDDMYVSRLGTQWMWRFNVSDPYNPWYMGANYGAPDMGNQHELLRDPDSDYMYVSYDDGLAVYDLTVPGIADIIELSQAPNIRHVGQGGLYAYLCDNTSTPIAVDVSNPHYVAEFGEPFGDALGFQVKGLMEDNGYLYILHNNIGIRIFDLY